MPIAGIVLFFFPLYYQFFKAPPPYPVKAANWVALAWTVFGIVLAIWLVRTRPERLKDIENVYVEDEDARRPARRARRAAWSPSWCATPEERLRSGVAEIARRPGVCERIDSDAPAAGGTPDHVPRPDRSAARRPAGDAGGAALARTRARWSRSPALYYAAAKIGLRLAYLDGAVTALWPPVGVGIAALVLYGPRLWPGIVIGDLLVADFSTPLGTVLGQTVGNTLEVVVAAVLLRRLTGGRPAMDRVGDVLALVGCGRGRDRDQRELRRDVAAARRRHRAPASSPRSGGRGGCRTSRARSS